MHRQYIIMLPVLTKFHTGDQDEIRIILKVFAKEELGIAQYEAEIKIIYILLR